MKKLILVLGVVLLSATGCSRTVAERESLMDDAANPSAEQADLPPVRKTLVVSRNNATNQKAAPASPDKSEPAPDEPKKKTDSDSHHDHGAHREGESK